MGKDKGQKITLIIGAGANKEIHSGIDLGKDLIHNIADRVTDRTSPQDKYFSNLLKGTGLNSKVCEEFVEKLDFYLREVSVPSIDAFLDEVKNFPEYEEFREEFLNIGRISIVFHVMGYGFDSTNIRRLGCIPPA